MNDQTIPTPPAGEPAGAAGRSAWDNFRDVVLEPIATFDDIGRRPRWLAPLIVIAAATLVTSFFLTPLGMEVQKLRLETAQLTPEQRERALAMMNIFRWVGFALAPIMVGIFTAVYALFMWAWGAIAGAKNATFKVAFTALLYTGGILVLQSVAQAIVVAVKGAEQVAIEGGPPTFGLALFIARGDMPKLLWGLVQDVNFFSIWHAAVVALAGIYALRMSRGAAYAFAVVVWLINVVFLAFQSGA